MTSGRHSFPEPPPGPFPRPRLQRARLLTFALGGGLLTALVVGGVAEIDYLEYHAVPREQAVVVHQVDGPEKTSCGRSESREVLTTYRVAEPRPGFPAEFVVSECPDVSRPGERLTVARRDPGERPDVSVDPLGGQLEVLGTAALFGGVGFAGVTLWQLFLYWTA